MRPGVRGNGSAPGRRSAPGQAAVGAQTPPHLRRGLSGAGVLRCLERGPKCRECQRLTSPRPAGLGPLPGRWGQREEGRERRPGPRLLLPPAPLPAVPSLAPAPVLLVHWLSPASTCLSSPAPPLARFCSHSCTCPSSLSSLSLSPWTFSEVPALGARPGGAGGVGRPLAAPVAGRGQRRVPALTPHALPARAGAQFLG